MCAIDRFLLHIDFDFFGGDLVLDPVDRWNFPQTQREIVRLSPDGGFEVSMASWGLVPFWAIDRKVGAQSFNARDDSLRDEKPMFREAFRSRRCLLVATSFVEYADRSGRKAPVEIIPNGGQPYFYAGLWERAGRGDEEFESCAMLTTAPNDLIAPIHSRMPAILGEDEARAWLDPHASRCDRLGLLGPHPAAGMVLRDAELPPRWGKAIVQEDSLF